MTGDPADRPQVEDVGHPRPEAPGQKVGLYEAIHRRRDVRAQFDGTPIPADVLERMLGAAHAAPSVGLSQPWDFVLVSDDKRRRLFYEHVQEERRAFAESLSPSEAERFAGIKIDGVLEASLSVVVTYDPARGAPHVLGRQTITDAGLYSACLAIENLWLAATAEGMGMGWVSFYRERFVRELLGIPESIRPVAWLCIGPVSHLESIPDLERHGWRERLPLSSVLHFDEWDVTSPQRRIDMTTSTTGSEGDRTAPNHQSDSPAGTDPDEPERPQAPNDEEAEDLSAMQAADDATTPPFTDNPAHPYTLAIDIGGTGLKASVLDATGSMVADRVRVPTTYPMSPDGENGMVATLTKLVEPLPESDRVAVGFPGMVRRGKVLSAPHFSTTKGPGTNVDPKLRKAWAGFDLEAALSAALDKPTKVANDADVQGAAVVAGDGLELVITLGTGFGTALFFDGGLLPHMEIAHTTFRKGETYNTQLGEPARKEIGDHRWNRRVRKAIEALDTMFFFDHLYVGGGNARRVVRDNLGELLARTTVVDNSAGILGGIKLWEGGHHYCL